MAAAAERARIAREIHDVVAHNVSVMVVQADGAAFALDSSPQRAREALAAISATGLRALAEMRSLLGVLRDSADQAAEPAGDLALAPQPGIGDLGDLLEQARSAGFAGVPHGRRGTPAGARGRGAGYLPGDPGVADERPQARRPGATARVDLRYGERLVSGSPTTGVVR